MSEARLLASFLIMGIYKGTPPNATLPGNKALLRDYFRDNDG